MRIYILYIYNQRFHCNLNRFKLEVKQFEADMASGCSSAILIWNWAQQEGERLKRLSRRQSEGSSVLIWKPHNGYDGPNLSPCFVWKGYIHQSLMWVYSERLVTNPQRSSTQSHTARQSTVAFINSLFRFYCSHLNYCSVSLLSN